jgi:hypothetical protein
VRKEKIQMSLDNWITTTTPTTLPKTMIDPDYFCTNQLVQH